MTSETGVVGGGGVVVVVELQGKSASVVCVAVVDEDNWRCWVVVVF